MFCEKCGSQLTDNTDFCLKCGTKFNTITSDNNLSNNEPIFEIRPTFKFFYVVLPKLLKHFIFIGLMIFIAIFFISSFSKMANSYSVNVNISTFMPVILVFLGIILIDIIIAVGKSIFEKKQYENCIYTFYNDRVVLKNNFLNVSEKELKYKNIREIAKRQTFIQKYFNIGNIFLFSNAETGIVSGVFMINIENIDDVYCKVKEITKYIGEDFIFCKNCGTKMTENARFCSKCGYDRMKNNQHQKEIAEDNSIGYKVKPEFNIPYKILSNTWWYIFLLYPLLVNSYNYFPIEYMITLVIILICILIKIIYDKMQCDYVEYNFYDTKVEYKDSFLNTEVKELEYKYIREIMMHQSVLERLFNIGTIRIFTNVSSGGYGTSSNHNNTVGRNGIYIHCIKNVQEQYRKIREIIDEGTSEE